MYKDAATAAQMRDSYYAYAAGIESRITALKKRIKERPPHSELTDLELRVSVLSEEKRELIRSAEALAKQAAAPPPSPSYAARMRAAR